MTSSRGLCSRQEHILNLAGPRATLDQDLDDE